MSSNSIHFELLLVRILVCIGVLVLSACRSSGSAARELHAPASEVTLPVHVAGNPRSGNVLIAIHGGPGMSSDYMASLEQLAGDRLAVVTYDQRGTQAARPVHPTIPLTNERIWYGIQATTTIREPRVLRDLAQRPPG